MKHREAARGLLLSGDALLLLRAELPDGSGDVCVAPGGGIDTGETRMDALRRELWEETGYRLQATSNPARVWTTRRHRYELNGECTEQHETYFVIETPLFEPTMLNNPTFREAMDFRGYHWWTVAERRSSGDLFAPRDLAVHLESLNEPSPETPLELPL